MDQLRLGEIKVRLHEGEGERMIGWASCVLNDSLFLNNIAIVRGDDGDLRLSYPCIRSQSDQKHFHFNPISREAQRLFDEAILGRLETLAGTEGG